MADDDIRRAAALEASDAALAQVRLLVPVLRETASRLPFTDYGRGIRSLVRALAHHVEQSTVRTHACPPVGSGVTPCCGKTPFELPQDDRLSTDNHLVDCDVVRVPLEALDRLRAMVVDARQQTYATRFHPGYIDCDEIADWLDSLDRP